MHRILAAATTVVLLIGLWGLLTSAAVADDAMLSESLSAYGVSLATPDSPTRRPLDVILAAQGWATGAPTADLEKLTLSQQLAPGLSLSHAFHSSAASQANAFLGTGLVNDTTDTLSLALTSRTQLAFSRQVTSTQDLLSTLLGNTQSNRLALTQGFGGPKAGSVSVERDWNTTSAGSGAAAESDIMKIASTLPFARNQSTFTYLDQEGAGAAAGTTFEHLMQLSMPMAMFGDTTHLDYKDDETLAAAAYNNVHLMTLAMPLTSWRKNAAFNETIAQNSTGGLMTTVATSAFNTPWRGLFTTGGFKQQYVTTDTGTSFKTDFITDLSAKINQQDLTLTRQVTDLEQASGDEHTTMLSLTTPKFTLFTPKATICATRLETQDNLVPSTGKTTVSVDAHPTHQVTVDAQMEQDTASPGTDTTIQNLLTTVTLSKHDSLQGRVQATSSPPVTTPATPTQVQQVQFSAAKPTPAGLGLLASYATFDTPGQTPTAGGEVKVTGGDPTKAAGVTAQFSEYDSTGLTPYQVPLVSVSIAHGTPTTFNVKLDYANQQGRAAPERALALAMPALGGSVQLGYAQNPFAVDGVTVVLADRYDASVQRSLAGLSFKVGYRQYGPGPEMAAVPVRGCLQLQVAGGAENRGGKLSLVYNGGDFVTLPTPTHAYTSMLDVSYARTFTNTERLVLTVHSDTAQASMPDLTQTTEGRLEYSTDF
jgi:hypothetical protein